MPEKISRELEEKILQIANESKVMSLGLSLRDIQNLLDVNVSIMTIARVLYENGVPTKGKPRSHKETDK